MRDYTNFERCNGEPCCVFAERICADNYKELLAACIRYGTSIIIDSDAHCEADVGNHSLAHAFLEEMHFPEELIVNTSAELLKSCIQYKRNMWKQKKVNC